MAVNFRRVLSTTAAALMLSVPATLPVFAQDTKPAAEKKMKDRQEYDLYEAIRQEQNAQKRLESLNTWKEKYAETDYKQERLIFYMTTYQQLQKWPEMMQSAKDLLALDPKNFNALYSLTFYTPVLQNTAPDALETGDKAAQGLLANVDTVFANANKPAAVAADQWVRAKTEAQAVAHKTLGWTAMIRKENEKAEEAFIQSLKLNPNAGEVSYWLGTVILAQRKVERTADGLFHIARAATYDGAGALPPAGRTQVNDYLAKSYTSFHGSANGLEQVKAAAKASVTPPAGFVIKSKVDLMKEDIAKEEELKRNNPELAVWLGIRDELKKDGSTYFDQMKGAAMPKLKGKVVSSTPEAKPKEIVIAISNDTTPEVTLKLDTPSGKVEPGTPVEFEGAVPTEFTAEPLMVSMDVERTAVKGLPAPAAGGAAKKKGAKKGGAAKKGKKR